MTMNSFLPLPLLAVRAGGGGGRGRTKIRRAVSLESTRGQVELMQTSPSISDALRPFILLQKTDWAGPASPARPPRPEPQWSIIRIASHYSSPSPNSPKTGPAQALWRDYTLLFLAAHRPRWPPPQLPHPQLLSSLR